MTDLTEWQSVQAERRRQLWVQVILQALEDVAWTVPEREPRAHRTRYASQDWRHRERRELSLARRRAEVWVGGKDFREVCSLAGFEPEPVEALFRKAIAARGKDAPI